ncbi:MAG: universal stress protein [Chloracidobacterium sp.]|nr:universal stress protein [Chloracidobacterium sp.]
MKVLLATDGTKFGDAAVEMLGKLALGTGDEVRVISVVDFAVPLAVDIYGGYMPDTTEVEKLGRENAERAVKTACDRIRSMFPADKISVACDVLFGSPDSRIVETAEEMGADLIVVGSHGYKRWERLLLGSVSNSVAHHAHCSVMIVRSDDD